MRIKLIAGAAVMLASQALAQESHTPVVESAYTPMPLDGSCATLETDDLGGVFMCAGYSGYGVLLAESDLRMSVFFGQVGPWYWEGAWESFQSFNQIGDTIEWRLADGVPFATVLRWTIEYDTSENAKPENNGEVLVISKVGQPGAGEACVVGYVDARANDDANEIAREIADTMALDFECRVDEPVFHGTEGILAPIPVRSFGP